jgi:hypothetical protein
MMAYRIDKANAGSTDDSGTYHHIAVLCASLQGATKDCEEAAESHSLLTTIAITKPTTPETSKHGPEIVHCDYTALFSCACDYRARADANSLNVSSGTVDRAHDTLVVSLEYESDGREQVE